MTTRFWMFHREGFVRLAIKEGETLSYSYDHPTDEGWSSFAERYTHEGDFIVRETTTDGRDCDGRLTATTLCRCPLRLLYAHDCGEPGAPLLPEWVRISYGQRDEYAERMGY